MFVKNVSDLYFDTLDWQASHSLTVVFFSRTFITPNKSSGQALNLQGRESETIRKDVDGRLYEVRMQMCCLFSGIDIRNMTLFSDLLRTERITSKLSLRMKLVQTGNLW